MKRRAFVRGGAAAAVAATVGWPAAGAGLGRSAAVAPGRQEAGSRLRGDLALLDGRIVTLDEQQPEAGAALVRDGRIVLVGTTRQVEAEAGDAPVLDARGRTVVPGFIDAHTHFVMACNARSYQVPIHTPPYRSLREIKEALRAAAAESPPGEWIIGRGSFGMADRVEEGRLPTREELDRVTDRHPLIMYAGFHVGMLNTAGFKAAGLWEPDSPSIPTGATVHRDGRGVPTGVATEVWTTLPAYSRDQVRASLRAHATELFESKGITTVHELPYGPDDVRAIQDLQASGDLPLRVRVYYHVPHLTTLDGVLAMGLLSGAGGEALRFGGVKIFVDGIGRDGLGNVINDVKWTQQALDHFVARADAADIQLMMHTVSERGEDVALEALARLDGTGRRRMSHRLEHANGGSSLERIRRFRALDLRPVITVSDPSPRPPGARRARSTPRWRTMVREGVEPLAVSDATGTVPEFSPLGGIAHMMIAAEDGGSAPAGETLSFEDALRTYTLFPARSSYEEDDKGSIEVGKLGDFVVLSADPRTLSGEELWTVEADATVVGGRVVHGE